MQRVIKRCEDLCCSQVKYENRTRFSHTGCGRGDTGSRSMSGCTCFGCMRVFTRPAPALYISGRSFFKVLRNDRRRCNRLPANSHSRAGATVMLPLLCWLPTMHIDNYAIRDDNSILPHNVSQWPAVFTACNVPSRKVVY